LLYKKRFCPEKKRQVQEHLGDAHPVERLKGKQCLEPVFPHAGPADTEQSGLRKNFPETPYHC
jgi:hypothetical protein